MFRLFSTPVWFHGWDLVFEAIAIIVALLIAAYSWRVYRLNKENRFAYFSLAFMLVAFSFLTKIFTSGVLYFTPVRDVALDVLRPVAGEGLRFTELMYRGGFFLEMASMLGAWLLIFFISQKPRERLKKYYEISQIGLFVYLILLISIIANFEYAVFYLTSAVLLSLIVLNYYKNYLNTGKKNTFRVMLSFFIILVGNLSFIFVSLFRSLYVFGELCLLLGFVLLLYTYSHIQRS